MCLLPVVKQTRSIYTKSLSALCQKYLQTQELQALWVQRTVLIFPLLAEYDASTVSSNLHSSHLNAYPITMEQHVSRSWPAWHFAPKKNRTVHKGAIDVKLTLAKIASSLLGAKQLICLGFLSMCQLQSIKDLRPKLKEIMDGSPSCLLSPI